MKIYHDSIASATGESKSCFFKQEKVMLLFMIYLILQTKVLTITPEKRPLQLHFNKTREETFVYNWTKMYIYLYESCFKVLILHCASVVANSYTKSQLIEMRLPKHLYQALCTLFHIERATFFKKGQLRAGLKQLNLKKNPF